VVCWGGVAVCLKRRNDEKGLVIALSLCSSFWPLLYDNGRIYIVLVDSLARIPHHFLICCSWTNQVWRCFFSLAVWLELLFVLHDCQI